MSEQLNLAINNTKCKLVHKKHWFTHPIVRSQDAKITPALHNQKKNVLTSYDLLSRYPLWDILHSSLQTTSKFSLHNKTALGRVEQTPCRDSYSRFSCGLHPNVSVYCLVSHLKERHLDCPQTAPAFSWQISRTLH